MNIKNNTVKLNKLFLLVIVFLFCAIIIKLTIVNRSATVDGLDLGAFADNRNTAKKTLYAKRGDIFDINGEILATSVNSYTVIGFLSSSRTTDERYPQHVIDKAKTAKELAPLLGISEESILEKLQFNGYQVELARGITEFTKSAITALDLDGIGFVQTTKRHYKMGTFASYTIGYARKSDTEEIRGEMGIESYFNDTLMGIDGSIEYQRDAYGYQIPNTPTYPVDPVDGSDIYLTIDNQIQLIAEKAVTSLKDYQMDWMTITIADAKTGAIVASASSPNFNLNTLDGLEKYVNPLVGYTYEPGSTMKVFSFLAAMENGIYNGEEKYMSGTLDVADSTIKDFNNVGWGRITYDTGFSYSSNVAASKLALALGTDKLSTYYKNAGFSAKTGIELPGELSGIVNIRYKTELANASFGQGITVTPIQMIQGLTAIANDGVMLKPYIVDKIVDSNGNVTHQAETTKLNTIASADSVNKMKDMMYDAVYSNLTDAKFYQSDMVSIIGKTGTAQMAGNNGYLTGKYDYIRSFAGLFPKEDPEYIVYVATQRFVGAYRDFANVTKTIIEEVAKIKNITDEESALDETKIIDINNYISSYTEETREQLSNLGLNVYVLGNGKNIINQYPLKGTKVIYGTKIFLLTNDSSYTMPNITNWTSNEVKTFCNIIGLNVSFEGYGSVLEQSIPPGTTINSSDQLIIKLNL